MINRLSNPINRNRSAAKIPKVMSSSRHLDRPFKEVIIIRETQTDIFCHSRRVPTELLHINVTNTFHQRGVLTDWGEGAGQE